MGFSLNLDDYNAPDTEWEDYDETIPARNARMGDRFAGGSAVFSKVANGHKYTTIFGSVGQQLFRGPLDDEIIVTRRRETKASRERTVRADKNRRVVREYNTAVKTLGDELSKALRMLVEEVEQFHYVDYWKIGNLMAEQAERRLWVEFIQSIEYSSTRDEYNEPVDFLDEFLGELKERMWKRHDFTRSISRSTNALSNLLDDVMREQTAKFIDHTKWW